MSAGVDAALSALDEAALVADLAALVAVPSVTGQERAVMGVAAGQARALGLDAEVVEYDLDAVRADLDHPGEEAPRDELVNLRVRLPGAVTGAPVLALCAHLDVVGPGTAEWRHGSPWSGIVEDGRLYGRGSADMKAGFAAALHAVGAVRRAGVVAPGGVEVLGVSAEEDGGLGAFAVLREDPGYAACVIPEPTGFEVVCAQAGAITFTGVVHGVAAHAAHRRQGASAIDRYLPVHAALQALEADLNAGVDHELMALLELPYPILVGRLAAGDWSSSVPDRLEFEGRAPVRVGECIADARAAVEQAVAAAGDGHVELRWCGGQFGAASTPVDHPLTELVRHAAGAALGEGGGPAPVKGVPWGADMRLFTARGIPTVMLGTSGIEVSHAVDECVPVAEVITLARALIRVQWGFGAQR